MINHEQIRSGGKLPPSSVNALDLYNFFLETYKSAPKDKLEFMEQHPNIGTLRNLGQTELTDCERMLFQH